jgi:hypothetical protein
MVKLLAKAVPSPLRFLGPPFTIDQNKKATVARYGAHAGNPGRPPLRAMVALTIQIIDKGAGIVKINLR